MCAARETWKALLSTERTPGEWPRLFLADAERKIWMQQRVGSLNISEGNIVASSQVLAVTAYSVKLLTVAVECCEHMLLTVSRCPHLQTSSISSCGPL